MADGRLFQSIQKSESRLFQNIYCSNQLVKVACPQCELKRWEEVENAAHINDYREEKKNFF